MAAEFIAGIPKKVPMPSSFAGSPPETVNLASARYWSIAMKA
jgi:hypothetical protein